MKTQHRIDAEPAGPVPVDLERDVLERISTTRDPLRELRLHVEPFCSLKGPLWQTFCEIAKYWSPDSPEAFPSQETLAHLLGVSQQSIRRWTRELAKLGLLSMRHELPRRDVAERIFYAIGPAASAAILQWATSGEAAAVRIRCTPSSKVPFPHRNKGEGVSESPEEVNSSKRVKNHSAFSSSDARARSEEKIVTSFEDEQAARGALGELFERKHRGRPKPRVFDAELVELAARCASSIEGGLVAKLEALRFAVAGAWHASDGPPSARFIFGSLEHFDEHHERGRARARALERKPTTPPREAVALPIEPEERAELGDVLEQLEAIGMR